MPSGENESVRRRARRRRRGSDGARKYGPRRDQQVTEEEHQGARQVTVPTPRGTRNVKRPLETGDGALRTGDGDPMPQHGGTRNKKLRGAEQRTTRRVVFVEDENEVKEASGGVLETGDGAAVTPAVDARGDKALMAASSSVQGTSGHQVVVAVEDGRPGDTAEEEVLSSVTRNGDVASTGDGERLGSRTSTLPRTERGRFGGGERTSTPPRMEHTSTPPRMERTSTPIRTGHTSAPPRMGRTSTPTRTRQPREEDGIADTGDGERLGSRTSAPPRTELRGKVVEGRRCEVQSGDEVQRHDTGGAADNGGQDTVAPPQQPKNQVRKPGLVEPPAQRRRTDKGRRPIEKPARLVQELRLEKPQPSQVLPTPRHAEIETVEMKEEAERCERKAKKRKLRASIMAARRQHKSELQAALDNIVTVAGATSKRETVTEMTPRRPVAPGLTAEPNVEMPEPSSEFRDALLRSEQALRARRRLAARLDELKEGYAKLAVAEAQRGELLAAGNVVGENDVRDGVADQLVTAAAGLKLFGEDDWVPTEDTPVYISRARRRYDKRVRKARAREWRRWQTQLLQQAKADGAFVKFDEEYRRSSGVKPRELTKDEAEEIGMALPRAVNTLVKRGLRAKPVKQYEYHSGSVYARPEMQWNGREGRDVRVGRLRAVQATARDALPTAIMEVRGASKQVKLDTCAQYSVTGPDWESPGERLDVLPPVEYMQGFTGETSKVKGVWRFQFTTQYMQTMVVDALVVDGPAQGFLLGEDWMMRHGVKIDFLTGEMKWYERGGKKIVPFTCTAASGADKTVAKVRLVKRAKVRTQTRHNVTVAVAAPEGTAGLFMPTATVGSHMLLAPTLATVQGGQVVVPVLNVEGKMTKLPSREALGTWQPVQADMEIMAIEGQLSRTRVQKWLDKEMDSRAKPLSNEDELQIGEMEDADRELLLKLLRNYPALLEPRAGCPPLTKLGVEHAIPTGTEAPVKMRARRYSIVEQEVIDREVDEMLKNGVIEEGSGAWGFPVVLVKKKDGTIRFCIDYRQLNAKTVKDVYPLPRIDETIESLHGARRFTSLDLHSGYWQIPVAEADRDKTGFVTRKGLFRFVHMPFGLSNTPGTFQRVMDAVLRGLTWQSCLVYLDDIIVFSRGDMARHVVELAAVLERLSVAGLSVKAKKCSFAARRLEYLGHELGEDGIKPMQSLVDSVARFPVPQDERVVKSFVHLAGYYRRFIANFGTKAALLTRLLRKHVDWHWGQEQQEAFETLKRELTERQLLAYPDFSKPFTLVTDALQVGLGAVLMQDHGRAPQPIAYASKVNSPTVAKYSITDLECAAVVWAIGLFRPYLYGRRFELVTDHAALSWLMKSKDLTGRLHRWALKLQEMDFSITYRPGSTNVVADALSRAPVRQVTAVDQPQRDEQLESEIAETLAESGQLTDAEIRVEQQRDREVQRLKRAKRYGGSEILQKEGLVYVKFDDETLRVVLPAALWAKAFREAHDSIFACHLRAPQTYARMAAVYWWPTMRTQVRQWVYGCRDCGSRKTKPAQVVPPLRSQGGGMPGDRWALDVAGPLPITDEGNRYVIAAVDYATGFAVAVAVPTHTAPDIAKFLVDRVVLAHGPMRELVHDGAPELGGKVLDALAALLQTRQVTPVSYRPRLLGLVERFHKVWKDMVAMFVNEEQRDWDRWLTCALYAYNGATHGTTGFSPNELMFGRRLRAPNELLRAHGVEGIENITEYHRGLVTGLKRARKAADAAIERDQRRRAKYHDRQVRHRAHFQPGSLVWLLRPPRGKGVTKLAHQWVGPARILDDAKFDNWRVRRLDTGDELVTHSSFVVSYHSPVGMLEQIARRTIGEMEVEERSAVGGSTEGDVGADGDGAGSEEVTAPGSTEEATSRAEEELGSGARSNGPAAAPRFEAEIAQEDATATGETPRAVDGNSTTAVGPNSGAARAPRTEVVPRVDQMPRNVDVAILEVARPATLSRRQQKRKRQTNRRDVDWREDEKAEETREFKRRADAAREARASRRAAARDGSRSTAEAQVVTMGVRGVPGGVDTATERETPGAEQSVEGRGSRGEVRVAQRAASRPEDGRLAGPDTARAGHGRVVRDVDSNGTVQPILLGTRQPGGEEAARTPAFIPAFLLSPTYGFVQEIGRRRVRNRAGRYELQYLVDIGKTRDGPKHRHWATPKQFERLFDDGRVGDDSDDVWTGGCESVAKVKCGTPWK